MKPNRRDLLKLAIAGLNIPWAGAGMRHAAAQGEMAPKRVLIFIDPYGMEGTRTSSTITTQAPWIRDEASDYTLQKADLGWVLAPLESHIANLSVVSGVSMKSRLELGGGISHAQVNAYTLTGSRNLGNFRSNPTMAHASIHNYIGTELNARATRQSVYDSLTIGGAGAYSYNADGAQTGALQTPQDIYETAFGLIDPLGLASQDLVVDAVRQQLQQITPELVQANATIASEAYRESLESITKELELRANFSCTGRVPDGVATAGTPQMFDATYDLFSCGLTSSIALGYTNGGKHGVLRDEELVDIASNDLLTNGNYHRLSHRGGDTAGAAQGLVLRNQIREIGRLADRLAETPELDGSGMMMDNTVIFFHQAMSQNTHSTRDPYYHFLLAGKGTNVQRGMHFDCSESTDNELWVTLAQAVGLPTQRFGGYRGANYAGDTINRGPIDKVLLQTVGA